MKPKFINLALLVVAGCVFVYAFFVYDNQKPLRYLPIFGEKEYEAKNGKTDTIFHAIQNFSFINQDGKTVTEKDFEGTVYCVGDYYDQNHRTLKV